MRTACAANGWSAPATRRTWRAGATSRWTRAHRLVADTLEADWNGKLRDVAACQEEYERRREADRRLLDEEQRVRVVALARDFPRLWKDPATSDRDRKRMVELLIEDVTLLRAETIAVNVRFKGGATRSLEVPRPVLPWEERKVAPEVLAEIDRLLDEHTEGEIAERLNRRGGNEPSGASFDAGAVRKIRRRKRLRSRFARLRVAGWLTLTEVSRRLRLWPGTVKIRRAQGLLGLAWCKLNDDGEYMYADPGPRDARAEGRVAGGDASDARTPSPAK